MELLFGDGLRVSCLGTIRTDMVTRGGSYISEANGKGMVFTFGRFNPPHGGHELLINKVISTAKKYGHEHSIYASQSQDSNKNPLGYNDKIKYMKAAFKQANVVKDPKMKNPFFVAKKLSDEGYKHVILVVGGDRVKDLEREIRKYIGHKDPNKSFNFDTFSVVSAGKRDPDSDDVTGMSASKMRSLASDGDFDGFSKGVPSSMSSSNTRKMYDSIRKSMGVREDISSLFDQLDVGISEEELNRQAINRLDLDSLQLLGIMEQVEEEPTVIILSIFDEEGEYSDTTDKLVKSCDKIGLTNYVVSVEDAYVVDEDMDDNIITIHNYNGNGKKLNLNTSNTVCFPRGSVLKNYSGIGILSIIQDTDIFSVNKLSSMELAQNKFATAIALERASINSPRTALVANEDAIEIALEKIGGEFPVVVKTITGAEGIGVSLVESRESLTGVLQSLWKFEAEVIIQEYFKIDYDIRSIVLDGKVIASAKRLKGQGDFRTNKSLGNETEPYVLSEEEIEIVEKAASVIKCYWCGVDHMVVDGEDGEEYKVLEVNGSPGSGAEPFHSYFGDGGEVSGQGMIDYVVDYVSDRENWVSSTTEIGAVEEIEIIGMGKADARIDTGNESYNVLHVDSAEYSTEDKDMVRFSTMGETKQLPVEEVVTINTGSGNKEKRMVVKLDLKIGSKTIKNVKFSLADREDNDYPILIGKVFLKNHHFSVDVAKEHVMKESLETLNNKFTNLAI